METARNERSTNSSLRVVFNGAVMTLGLPADATYEDLARALKKIPKRRYGSPVGVRVTLGRKSPKPLLN